MGVVSPALNKLFLFVCFKYRLLHLSKEYMGIYVEMKILHIK